MQSATWNVLIKLAFFSGSYIYGPLFHFNDSENNLSIGIKLKLLKLHMAWEKC